MDMVYILIRMELSKFLIKHLLKIILGILGNGKMIDSMDKE